MKQGTEEQKQAQKTEARPPRKNEGTEARKKERKHENHA
jgi:hypothetical protein